MSKFSFARCFRFVNTKIQVGCMNCDVQVNAVVNTYIKNPREVFFQDIKVFPKDSICHCQMKIIENVKINITFKFVEDTY